MAVTNVNTRSIFNQQRWKESVGMFIGKFARSKKSVAEAPIAEEVWPELGIYADIKEKEYIERQAKLFDESKEELLHLYEGKYVLFEDGNVLDVGDNRETLAMKAYQKYGMKPLFIEQVIAQSPEPKLWTPISSSWL